MKIVSGTMTFANGDTYEGNFYSFLVLETHNMTRIF